MKRKLFAILICALVFGATSALADSKVTGFYRLQGIMMSQDGLADSNTITAYDQRFRVKWDNMINDAVSVTWYGEVDMPWGVNGKEAATDSDGDTHSHGGGGKIAADGVNVETKNVYATVKVASVTAKIGMQTYLDNTGSLVYFSDDVSALNLTTAFDKVSLGLLVAKALEGSTARTDDENIYALVAGFAVSETMKINAGLWWDNVQASGGTADDTKDVYTATVSANMKFGGVGVDGFVAYQTGNNTGDQDVNALAASVAAAMKAGPADLALRVIYYGADDDAEDDMAFEQRSGELEYVAEGQEIFLTNGNKCNIFNDRIALRDAAYAGYGLFGAVLKASTKVSDFAIKGSVGYYMALDDSRNDEATASREGTDLGFEIDAGVSYKLADNATLQVRGAYAMLGSFYDNSAAGGEDPDDLYRAVCQLDVTF